MLWPVLLLRQNLDPPDLGHRIKQIEEDAVNQEALLAELPDNRDDAKSLKEIANEMGWTSTPMLTGFAQRGVCPAP